MQDVFFFCRTKCSVPWYQESVKQQDQVPLFSMQGFVPHKRRGFLVICRGLVLQNPIFQQLMTRTEMDEPAQFFVTFLGRLSDRFKVFC